MQTTVHIFHKPEEAEAFMFGIDHMGDDQIENDIGPEPNEVTLIDHGCDEGSPDRFFDHRLQISNPTITATHPDSHPDLFQSSIHNQQS